MATAASAPPEGEHDHEVDSQDDGDSDRASLSASGSREDDENEEGAYSRGGTVLRLLAQRDALVRCELDLKGGRPNTTQFQKERKCSTGKRQPTFVQYNA